MTVMSDVSLIGISYTVILHAVFNLPSRDAHQKALGTGVSHGCVILLFYTPAISSALAHHFGHNIPHSFHTLLASLYEAIPPVINPIVYVVKAKQIRDKINSCSSPKQTIAMALSAWERN